MVGINFNGYLRWFPMLFPNKWRWVQIGICLGIAALSFFRVLLGVQMFVPIVFGSTWLLNAVILITVKLITERPSKPMKYPEINLVENRTYVAEVRPKKW